MPQPRKAEDLIVYERRIFRFKRPIQVVEGIVWDSQMYGEYRVRTMLTVGREGDAYEEYAKNPEELARKTATMAVRGTEVGIYRGAPLVLPRFAQKGVHVGYPLAQDTRERFEAVLDELTSSLDCLVPETLQ